MAKLKEAIELIKIYQTQYRNSELKPYDISEKYDLFPDKIINSDNEYCWNAKWPNSERAGVYLILDDQLDVIYIGKADYLGPRLSSYFHYDENRNCKIINYWNGKPRFILTVAVPDSSKFENASLEAFLISKIKTKNNIQGSQGDS